MHNLFHLRSRCWQTKVHLESQEKTTFATYQGLHQLLVKGIAFNWTSECQQASVDLKEKLVRLPVDKSFVLETDASIQRFEAVLSQKQSDGKLHPVAYVRCSFSSNQERYAITDIEKLAVVWVINHFQYHLYGHDITVHIDHKAVNSRLYLTAQMRQGSIRVGRARSTALAFALSTSPTGQVKRTPTLTLSPDSPASWSLQATRPVHSSRWF